MVEDEDDEDDEDELSDVEDFVDMEIGEPIPSAQPRTSQPQLSQQTPSASFVTPRSSASLQLEGVDRSATWRSEQRIARLNLCLD